MSSILEDHEISFQPKQNHGISSHQMGEITDEIFHCGLNADSDAVRYKHESFLTMLLWLKSVAVDHYRANTSRNSQESWSQILNARKLLSLSHDEVPWRKRKLNQLLQGTVPAATDLRLKKPNERSSTRRERGSIASSSSCLIDSVDSEGSSGQIQNRRNSVRSQNIVDNLSHKVSLNGYSFQPDALERCSPSDSEVFPLLDSDDSVSGSNLSYSTKLRIRAPPHTPIKLLKYDNNDPRKQVFMCSSLNGHVKGSNPLGSKKPKKHTTPQKSAASPDFIGDYVPRMAIPVGPRFQAKIPDLIGIRRDVLADANSKKWLGYRIWPIEGINTEISREVIGKGRTFSCLCTSPGSVQCVKQHVSEKRVQLRSDISSAFFSWKFDEMGEEVSKSWLPTEQKSFRILVKMNPLSKNLSFLGPALKCFPSKSRKGIVSYYFNVFMLRRMSMLTRLGPKVVDSDDDEEKTDEGVSQSPRAKLRYLTGLR